MRGGDQVRRRYDAVTAELNRNADGVRHLVHYADEPVATAARRPGARAPAPRLLGVHDEPRPRPLRRRCWRPSNRRLRGCTVPLDLSQLSSKLYLAWLSDPAARPASLTGAEEDAVRTLVPWTRVPALLGPDDTAALRRDRAEHVLKKADSHQAKEVHFGWTTDDAEWTALLRGPGASRRSPRTATPASGSCSGGCAPGCATCVEITDKGAVRRRTGLSCCPYLMGGKVRGLETWLTPGSPDLDMIRRMHFAPHFVLG